MTTNEVIKKLDECINLLTSLKSELATKEEVKEDGPTLTELRSILTALVHEGYTTNIRVLLLTYGVSSLSNLDPKYYKEVYKKALELVAYRGSKNATK